jgi:succinate-acetate transporter protein
MSGQGNGWANPGPAGLFSLAIAVFCFYALLCGKVDHSCIPLMACWLLGGFIVQIVVALIELRENNIAGGNVFLYFSAFFMFTSGISFMFKYFAGINGWAVDATIDGYAWIVLWVATWMITPAYFKSPITFTIMVFLLDLALPIVCLQNLGVIGHQYASIAGNLLLFAGILAIYYGSAGILNTVYGKVILPVGKPIVKESVGA